MPIHGQNVRFAIALVAVKERRLQAVLHGCDPLQNLLGCCGEAEGSSCFPSSVYAVHTRWKKKKNVRNEGKQTKRKRSEQRGKPFFEGQSRPMNRPNVSGYLTALAATQRT